MTDRFCNRLRSAFTHWLVIHTLFPHVSLADVSASDLTLFAITLLLFHRIQIQVYYKLKTCHVWMLALPISRIFKQNLLGIYTKHRALASLKKYLEWWVGKGGRKSISGRRWTQPRECQGLQDGQGAKTGSGGEHGLGWRRRLHRHGFCRALLAESRSFSFVMSMVERYWRVLRCVCCGLECLWMAGLTGSRVSADRVLSRSLWFHGGEQWEESQRCWETPFCVWWEVSVAGTQVVMLQAGRVAALSLRSWEFQKYVKRQRKVIWWVMEEILKRTGND